MLVLTRVEGEGIRLDLPDGTHGWIVVTEVECHLKGPRVRIGFDFPQEVKIARHELLPPAALEGAPASLWTG